MPGILVPIVIVIGCGVCSSKPVSNLFKVIKNKSKECFTILSNKIQINKFIKKTYKTNCEEDCIICFDNYLENNKCSELYCGHKFHKDCLLQWMNERKTCPLCNTGFILASGKTYGQDAGDYAQIEDN